MTCLISAAELAKRLGTSRHYVYKYAKRGQIPSITLPGGSIRFDPEVVNMLAGYPSGVSVAPKLCRPRVKEKLWE